MATTKFAWVEDGRVRDVCWGNPAELYHPDIAKFYTEVVPEGTTNAATKVNGTWKNPEPPAERKPTKKDLLRQEALALLESKFEAAVRGKDDTQLPTADQILKGT